MAMVNHVDLNVIMFKQWTQNMRKVRKRFPKFYKRNTELYNTRIVKGFNLGICFNKGRILNGNEEAYKMEIRRIERLSLQKRVEGLSGWKLKECITVDTDVMGRLSSIRNILLGIFLRKY